ncbi:sugar transferase [Ktedonosporobacter rubrisoli]|nr:sugar transferase [Ktedonosporobacter rubrisoli]
MAEQQEQPFANYLHVVDILLTGLPSSKRQEIHRELFAHLEDAASERGLSTADLDLQREVIVSLGSGITLGEELYKAHRRPDYTKRIFDICLATFFLLLLSPLLALIALLIKLDSPGPVFYRSTQVGRDGRRFKLYAFRTMNCWQDTALSTELPANARITRIGHFLRNTLLDELPRLLNVLRGDMSLIGHLPTQAREISFDDPRWRRVLLERPGISSSCLIANGLGFRYFGNRSVDELESNMEYLKYRSFRYDLYLIGRTLALVWQQWQKS